MQGGDENNTWVRVQQQQQLLHARMLEHSSCHQFAARSQISSAPCCAPPYHQQLQELCPGKRHGSHKPAVGGADGQVGHTATFGGTQCCCCCGDDNKEDVQSSAAAELGQMLHGGTQY